MTSPFEHFTKPSDRFDADATEIGNLAATMAEEDPHLTIGFLMASIIVTAITHNVMPQALVSEFRNAIRSFSRDLATGATHDNATEH